MWSTVIHVISWSRVPAGIRDDCVITCKSDHVYMVVNAGCKDADIAYMRERLAAFNAKGGGATFDHLACAQLLTQLPNCQMSRWTTSRTGPTACARSVIAFICH